MRRSIRTVVLLGLAFAGIASERASAQDATGSGPQFLLAVRQPSKPPVLVDAASVPVLRRRISLELSDVSRGEALAAISRASDLRLVYANGVVPRDGQVRLHAREITVAAALTEALLGAGVDVLITPGGNVVLVKRVAVIAPMVGGVSGRVTDAKTGRPVAAAEVSLQGVRWHTATDTAGRYHLVEVDTGTYTLAVRRLGYARQTRRVRIHPEQEDSVDFVLQPVAARLNELVTTATGQRRRLDIANDVTTINADSAMKAAPIRSVTDLLENRVPGLTVQHTSGAPGDPSRLRLRGAGSPLRNNDPIVFVDGIRVYAEQSAARSANLAGGGYATPSPLDYIDPNSIEKIDVLKGPSAATLYGPDAANGVIVITTKKGKAGPTRWTASVGHSRTTIGGDYPELVFGWGHSLSTDTPLHCQNIFAGQFERCQFDSVTTFQILNDPELTVLGRGHGTSLSLSASGGTTALTYSVTGSYQEDLGFIKLPDYELERYRMIVGREVPDWAQRPQQLTGWGVTSGITARLGSTADLTLHASLSRTNQQRSPLEYSLGTLMTTYFDRATETYYGPDGLAYSNLTGSPTGPLGSYYARITDVATAFTNALALNWRPRSWLMLTADAGLNVNQRVDEISQPSGAPRRAGTVLPGQSLTDEGASALSSAHGQTVVSTVNLRGNAQVPLGVGFQFRFAAGLNYSGTSIDDQSLQVSGVVAGAGLLGSTITGGSHSSTDDATFGWYLEPSVGNSKLNFTTGLRLDGSSSYGLGGLPSFTFPPKFPKLGFSYLVSDEPWFPFKGLIQSFRTRVSYGRAGRQPGPTERLRLYSASQGVWGDGRFGTGVYLQDLGNTELRPERSSEWEGGIDADLLNSRLTILLTAHHKTTDDAILSVPVPQSVYGSNVSVSKNIGVIRNTGLELEIGASLLQSGPVTWRTTVQVTQNRNMVVRLGPGVEPFYTALKDYPLIGGTRVAAGYPLFGHWSRPVLGYADIDGNGVLELSEIVLGDTAVYTGQSEPNYGATLSSTVSLWRGAVIIDAGLRYDDGLAQDNGPWTTLRDYSRGRNDPSASLAEQALASPLTTLTDYYDIQTVSSVRFNSLSVRYAVPALVTRWLRAQTLSIAVQGSNLGLWTNYRGMDPGVNAFASGNEVADRGTLPQPRLWQVQVNATY